MVFVCLFGCPMSIHFLKTPGPICITFWSRCVQRQVGYPLQRKLRVSIILLISIIPWICINSSDLYFMSNRSELSRKRINRDKSRSSVKSDFGTPCILLLHLINPKSVSKLMRKEISKLLSAVLRLSFIFCVSGSLIRNKWIQVISFFTSATLFILSRHFYAWT